MGCASCGTGKDGLPGGCKNNGACGTYGCNKMEVFNWLSGMALPEGQKPFDMVEVRFKNSRKGYYRNVNNLELYAGDVVAVEASPGHDVGVVSLAGELVRIQMKRKDVKDNYEVKKLYRKAKEDDIARWQEGRTLEQDTMMRARTIARELKLEMKLSDVEYQGDKTKATFYYTADGRVDFRELIRRYADTFKLKVEMRQIGYRQEAGRLGGIGSCGRELCCSSWLTDYRAVSTSAARYQQLSLNPQKLAGQCGKLKCCLNYELDTYVEALKDFPNSHVKLQLPKGVASHFKSDLFKKVMFYTYDGQHGEPPFPLSTDAVRDIIDRNRKGIQIADVEEFMVEEITEDVTDFAQVVGQDSLTRFDRKRGRGGKGRNSKRGDKGRPQQGQGPATAGNVAKPAGPVGAGAGQGSDKSRPKEGRPPQQRNQQPRRGRGDNRGNNPRPPAP
ncbi:MAG: regulatory iron-sulfur-containing complex subunit RicT [Flavobacteriales bacterium]